MFVYKLRKVTMRTDFTPDFYFILSLGIFHVSDINIRKAIKRQIFLNKSKRIFWLRY